MGACLSQMIYYTGVVSEKLGINIFASPGAAHMRAVYRNEKAKAARIVTLDGVQKGPGVTVSNFHVTGEGTVLGSAALYQDRAYWEVVVVRPGAFGLGVARRCSRSQVHGLDTTKFDGGRSWGAHFRVDDDDGSDEEESRPSDPFGDIESAEGTENVELYEGDVIAVVFDQSDLPKISYFLNGKEMKSKRIVGGVKGVVFPAFVVQGETMLNIVFSENDFKGNVPQGFSGIVPARDVI